MLEELNFLGKCIGLNNLQSLFLVVRDLDDFDILSWLFHHRFGHRLPIFSWFREILSVPSKSVYVCCFFVERKQKHLDFFSLVDKLFFKIQTLSMMPFINVFLPQWWELHSVFSVGVLSLEEVIQFLLGIVCLYSDDFMWFKLWT